MSGICAIVGGRFTPEEGRQALAAMMRAGAHRGPDGSGTREFPGALLGHHRLDLRAADAQAQPLGSADGRHWIVFDGEIQNADELTAALADRGIAAGPGDASLALAAWQAWGEASVDRIDGLFAFAVWDAAERRLFCARDRMGVRPLFRAEWRGGHAFASEIGQLLALPGFDRRPNEAMVADYLFADISLREESFFAGIHRLPAGWRATVGDGRLELAQYWDIDPERQVRLADDAEYGERFRELLTRSVARNMRSELPLGAALSGGLDSSSVVCLADRLRREAGITAPMQTFSLAFEDRQVDESEHVAAVAAATNIRHNHYYADHEDLFSHLRSVQQRQAEPMRSLGIVLFWRLKQLAAASGQRILLNGMGADEVLGGINLYYLADLLREGRWLTLARNLDTLVAHDPYALRFSRAKYLKFFGLRPLLPAEALVAWRRWRKVALPEIAAADFARRLELDRRSLARRPMLFREHYRHISYEGLRHHYTALLLHYEDANNAGFGMESRFPFIDRELVEFLFALPREQKVRDATAKVVLRNGMRGILPDSVRNRVDKGFIDRRVDHWLGHQYRDMVEAVFHGRALADSGWLDMAALQRLYRSYQENQRDRFTIWKCFNLGLWLECFFG